MLMRARHNQEELQGQNVSSAFSSPLSLCRDAADTLCALALALGPDLALFVPALRKVGTGSNMCYIMLRPCLL